MDMNLKAEIVRSGKKIYEIADNLKMDRLKFYRKLKSNSFTAQEYLAVLQNIGYNLKVEKIS